MSLTLPTCSVRRYGGEHSPHEHDHAQIMFALSGRMALELNGHAAFADASSGIVIPAGVAHAYAAPAAARMLVIDAPMQPGTDRPRRFAVRTAWRDVYAGMDVQALLHEMLGMPRILARRSLDTRVLDAALDASLHEDWSTARMAALFCLSPQRFHARLLELTGLSPMAYARRRRLEAAMRLVAQGLLLDAVALRVGYQSASALSFALQRDCGFSTRACKRRC
ncbi:helix-turn-helix domain-containing protein [Variovorax terrae]|uniref:AraC family transcriptional regulator n=1 Tax=Variovorax terrae TaxID=2923278 RepID=A0A9X1VUZ8_9BURK|nr:AraC family transcriptional regulator [Variovorax terrae]MCJ0763738.1 AraC family transcriptional regulator [Variovorax terrae]